MKITGIKTHNLKNLDFFTNKYEIIGVYGISGGGKSSFAYSTIYKMCSDAFDALQNGYLKDSEYIVEDYDVLMPSIALRQQNFNQNPNSTIYSYLNFSSILSSYGIDYSLLKLNKPQNFCSKCKGVGKKEDFDEEL